MSNVDKGFSIIISFHNEFRGLFPFPQLTWGWSNPEGISWKVNLGFIRIEKRHHIENLDRRLIKQLGYDGYRKWLSGETTQQ